MSMIALSAATCHAACFGVLEEKDDSRGGPDAAVLGGVVEPACDDPAAISGDGNHNAGEDCLQCHRQGGEGPPWTIGGTVYADREGSAPAPGVSIHLIDATGRDLILVSQENGNFWSTDVLEFPVAAFASLCPDVEAMAIQITREDASCNQSGCHTEGFRVSAP